MMNGHGKSNGGSRANPADAIGLELGRAFREAAGVDDVEPSVAPAQNPQFGDYQSNAAMALAKRTSQKPRDLAQRVVEIARRSEAFSSLVEEVSVAGPGFINVRLRAEALGHMLASMHGSSLGVGRDADPHSVVIDLCGVNVAKQMHVGHLRSTIIGDSLARVMERLGRNVIRQNHLGDWGLQIAMVLHMLRSRRANLAALDIAELERAYREAQKLIESDEPFATEVKRTLVQLQRGDPDVVRDWQAMIDVTMRAVYEVLDMLGVHLDRSTERGESFYREKLAGVVEEFLKSGVAKEDAGAIVVPFDDRERPLLIRKSDGGFLYSTTDLAAIRHRVRDLGADRIIYVVDARQRDHFRDVFDAVRKIGWDRSSDGGAPVDLVHVPFGAVLGEDRRPLKTRSGENVTLKELLAEAIERGTAEVMKRAQAPEAPTHGLSDAELRAIGKAVGIGAVKYADLSSDLGRDYVFNMDRMIAFEGNTGPYIQYAHARICSIFGKYENGVAKLADAPIMIAEPAERALALLLLRYGSVVQGVADSLEPHRLCMYLFELANGFSAFYQACPVLRAESDDIRRSRLRLSLICGDVIADGLRLLGIEAPTRM
jgi:arginyl-tRNA synthetase